ncbi:hypothetical protein ACFLYH_02020 [Candidatus Dependentiae bacterium]
MKKLVCFICISSILFLKNNYADNLNLHYQDVVLIYQQLGSKLHFLYSKCNTLDKTQISKNCYLNIDYRNRRRVLNPDNLEDNKKIKYGDEIMLHIITPDLRLYFLYGEKVVEFNYRYTQFYVKEKLCILAEEISTKWGRFKILNPFSIQARDGIRLDKPFILEYLQNNLGNGKYLGSTASLTDTPEIWNFSLAESLSNKFFDFNFKNTE